MSHKTAKQTRKWLRNLDADGTLQSIFRGLGWQFSYAQVDGETVGLTQVGLTT